jgi:hypothetical protein
MKSWIYKDHEMDKNTLFYESTLKKMQLNNLIVYVIL